MAEYDRRLQKDSGAELVRNVLATMPAEFTIRDVMNRLGSTVAKSSASAALRWARERGVIKFIRRASYSEWKGEGQAGAPPLVYSFVGFENFQKPSRSSARSYSSYKPRKQLYNRRELPAPTETEGFEVPENGQAPTGQLAQSQTQAPTQAPSRELIETVAAIDEGPHQCPATDVLAHVQRTLGTLNLLIAVQQMSPEQVMALSGTINQLGQQQPQTHRRGRR